MQFPSYGRRRRRIFGLATVMGLSLLGAVGSATSARAQLIFTLTPNTLTDTPGQTVTFTGTLTNNYTGTVYLTGGQFPSTSSAIIGDTSSFLGYAPVSLAHGATYTGNIFDAQLIASATPGTTYQGTFQIYGGTDPSNGGSNSNNQAPLALQDFFITATSGTATPEPSAFSLVLGGIGTCGAIRLRRRRRNGK